MAWVDAGVSPPGTVHPILARDSSHPKPSSGRPRRRYYHLTSDGAERARIALAQARTQITNLPVLKPG